MDDKVRNTMIFFGCVAVLLVVHDILTDVLAFLWH